MLRKVVCAVGENAAAMLYHRGRFSRERAVPPSALLRRPSADGLCRAVVPAVLKIDGSLFRRLRVGWDISLAGRFAETGAAGIVDRMA
jgi:hypothetical protein